MTNQNRSRARQYATNLRTIAIAGLIGFCPLLDAVELSFSVGTESFTWYELDDAGSRLLTENGSRQQLALHRSNRDGNLEHGLTAIIYGGDVNYAGQLMDGTPFVSLTGYNGLLLESTWNRHNLFGIPALFGEFSLGVDVWRRTLDKGGSLGYVETYQLLNSRLGAGFRNRHFYIKMGLKSPWSAMEMVDLGLILNPQPRTTPYLETGYGRIDGLRFIFNVDGYSFGRSPNVGTYYQPESIQHTYAVKLAYAL